MTGVYSKENFMKKIFSFFIALTMLFTLVGCTNKTTSSDKSNISDNSNTDSLQVEDEYDINLGEGEEGALQ